MKKTTFYSSKWKEWLSELDERTCVPCRTRNGTIYAINTDIIPKPPLHGNCRCAIVRLRAMVAGSATDKGKMGADWIIKNHRKLPDYYISKSAAHRAGWSANKGDLSVIAPGKMIFGGVFNNFEGKLPHTYGRIWYEADINYISGSRNSERILFSNDGLIFVTYDHYNTFIEIQ